MKTERKQATYWPSGGLREVFGNGTGFVPMHQRENRRCREGPKSGGDPVDGVGIRVRAWFGWDGVHHVGFDGTRSGAGTKIKHD